MVPLYQAYLDDSGRASGPTYVIAGFLSTAKTWRWVAQKWKELLDTPPILAYFKMKEAMNPGASKKHQSQFFGWPREAIDETIELFTELIWRTVSMRIRITVPNIEYGHIFKGKVGPHVDFPYWLAHVSAMMETTRLLAAHGIQEKVDFIFDTASEREQHWILNAWHFWKQNDWFEERKPYSAIRRYSEMIRHFSRFRPRICMRGTHARSEGSAPKVANTNIQGGTQLMRRSLAR